MGNSLSTETDADPFPDGLRILVVDHDSTYLSSLEKLITNCGHTVSACNSLQQALELLRYRNDEFDAVMCDDGVPDLDGFLFLDEIAGDMQITVIMMTATSDTRKEYNWINHGASTYLIKPIKKKQIQNIWQRVYRKRIDTGQLDRMDNTWKRRREAGDDGSNSLSSVAKKPRISWTPDLHAKFVEAVNHLGIKAGPKKILRHMNVEGLTREHVSSHLQKFRQGLAKQAEAQSQALALQVHSENPSEVASLGNQDVIDQNLDIVQQPTPDGVPNGRFGEGILPMRATTSLNESLQSHLLADYLFQADSSYGPSTIVNLSYNTSSLYTQPQNHLTNHSMVDSIPLIESGGSNGVLGNNIIGPSPSMWSEGNNHVLRQSPPANYNVIDPIPCEWNGGSNHVQGHNPLTNRSAIDPSPSVWYAGYNRARELRAFSRIGMRKLTCLPNGNNTEVQANQGPVRSSAVVDELKSLTSLPNGNNTEVQANQGPVSSSAVVDELKSLTSLPNGNNIVDLQANQEPVNSSYLVDGLKNLTSLPNGNSIVHLQANQGPVNSSVFVDAMNNLTYSPSGNNKVNLQANQGRLVNNFSLLDEMKNLTYPPSGNSIVDLEDSQRLDFNSLFINDFQLEDDGHLW